MATSTTRTNKPINPRGNDQSPKGYNRAALYSGKALDFDGTNDNVSLDGFTMSGNTATISFYLKADDWDANSFIFGAGTPEIVIGSTTGGNNLSFYDSSSWKTFGTISDTTSTNFFSIVFDGTTAIAYMNGVKFGDTLTITAIDLSSVTGVRLMSKYTGGVFFFNGQLSGFKIFNTALTAAQVSDLYNNPEKIVPTGVSNDALKLWLPMMEGAGTTAYDGSGNGNHGTISGATYVNGVGAPVAQSAVMDWNKTSNIIAYSEQFDQWTQFGTGASITANNTTAPDGLTTADKFTFPAGVRTGFLRSQPVTTGSEYRFGVWLKADAPTTCRIFVDQGCATFLGAVVANITTEWQLFSVDITPTAFSSAAFGIDTTTDTITACGTTNVASTFYAWGAFAHLVTEGDAYVKTDATAQTSPVLLPQGLTSGRDITGVNLFENVRKQGALNLDGNSWAEVHDNASLDFGTGSFTLEAWAKAKYTSGGSIYNVIMILGGNASTAPNAAILVDNSVRPQAMYNNQASVTPAQTTGDWYHIVAAYNETDMFVFINGAQVLQNGRTAVDITNTLVKYIGRDSSTQRYYSDQIAQPRIYNRALTAEEVERNYNAGKNIYK